MHIRFDDNAVRCLPDGQDMIAEFREVEIPPMWRSPLPDGDALTDLSYLDNGDGGGGFAKSKYYKVLLVF